MKRKARTLTDFFQKAEPRRSDPSACVSLPDAEARDRDPCVSLESLSDAGGDELEPEARCTQERERSEQPMAITTSNINPGPGSVSRTDPHKVYWMLVTW